jgi:hypothetical protein
MLDSVNKIELYQKKKLNKTRGTKFGKKIKKIFSHILLFTRCGK